MSMFFSIFEVLFSIAFIFILGVMIVTAVRGIGTWNKNNHSPRLSVAATVVTKRTNVSHHHHANAGDAHGFHTTTSTTYYVTFQVESGDRMELSVSGTEYGQMAEGDAGVLFFQGTRFLAFERNKSI